MIYNSHAISLILAVCVSFLTASFTSLVSNTPILAIVVSTAISFASTYLLAYVIIEFVIFKELHQLYEKLDAIKKEEFYVYTGVGKATSNPLRIINKEITAYITHKQKEVDELKKLANYRKEFIANVSHELKTPLFAAQGYIMTLLEGALEDEKVRYKFLEKASKSLDNLDILVQDLLTLSQIESGMIKMHFEIIDIQQIIDDALAQLEDEASEKEIELIFEPETKPVLVSGDALRLTQVFINLVSNAIRYNQIGGLVEVKLEDSPRFVNISIIDNGIGIAETHLARIFERFYRVDKSRSRQQGGTGLGLAIVKHIIEGHASKITVQSEVGKGTTFSFKLEKAKKRDEKI